MHTAVKINILTVSGVFGNHDSGVDVIPTIAFAVLENRQHIQIRIRMNGLTGGSTDHLGRRSFTNSFQERRDDFRDLDTKITGKGSLASEEIPHHPEV